MILSVILAVVLQTPQPVVVVASGPPRPAVVVIDGKAYTVSTVSIDSFPVPPGPPAPTPPDPPKPTPVAGVLHVSLVVADNDVAQAQLRTNGDLRMLVGPQLSLHTYTADDPTLGTLKLSPWVAKAGGFPAVVLQSEDGKVLESSKITNAADVLATVKRWRP